MTNRSHTPTAARKRSRANPGQPPGNALKPPPATSQLIRQSAVDLFFEYGYAETSLRQIADAVGLQVGSLYNHISSKEDLLFEIMKGVMVDLIEATEQALTDVVDPVDRVRVLISAGIRFHAEHQHAALVGNTELRALSPAKRRSVVRLRDRYQSLLEQLLHEAAVAGRIDVPDLKMATYAGIAILNHVASWYQPEGRLSVAAVERDLLAMYAPTSARPDHNDHKPRAD